MSDKYRAQPVVVQSFHKHTNQSDATCPWFQSRVSSADLEALRNEAETRYLNARVASSPRRVTDGTLKKRLDGVDDSIREVFDSVQCLIKDTFDLVDNRTKGGADTGNVVHHVIDVAEQILDRVDEILQHGLQVVVLVIVGEPLVCTELGKSILEAEQVGVECCRFICALLFEVLPAGTFWGLRQATEVASVLTHLSIVVVQDVDVAENGVDVATNRATSRQSVPRGTELLNRVQYVAFA